MVRSDLECTLHRLANYLEGQLSDVLRDLLASSMVEECRDITYNGCTLIESLREACDGKEGGEG